MVYLPLGAFALGAVLVVLRVITGGAIVPVGLLGVYAVVPARVLMETKRKGLALPRPPGAKPKGEARTASGRTKGARRPFPSPEGNEPKVNAGPTDRLDRQLESEDEQETPHDEVRQRSLPAARKPGGNARSSRVDSSARPSAQIIRRRALAGVVGIGALLLVGGILVIVGIGRVTSSLGLVMVGIGGFLMILSVTLPTFRLVDAVLRGIGRLVSRGKPAPSRRPRNAKPD